jgi:large subunit ribosomal protein L6
MSRIGNKTIEIPDKVKINIAKDGLVNVEGPKGKLHFTLPAEIKAELTDKELSFKRANEDRKVKALHGLSRSLLANMIQGVTAGYVRDLEIQGVGFKAAVQGAVLNLSLGKSHPILFPIPEGIKITVTENTKVRVEGIDKQVVGQVAANIRGYYPPEPYKGKGVRYAGEKVQRKEGKTVQ